MKISAMTANADARAGPLLPDEALMTAAREGDIEALEALLVRYQPQLYRFGLRMCGNADDAGEIAQESLIAMARSLRSFRGDASVSSWLYTITRRVCIKKRRRSKFAPAHEQSLDAPGSEVAQRLTDPAPDPEHIAASREVEAALAAAIGALDQGQREVLVLRDVQGLSAPEVARVVGISVDAVKSRLHRARVAVRNQMAPMWTGLAAVPPRTRKCPGVLTLFSRHLEGEIDQAVCARMEAHLAQCDYCRGACDMLRRTLAVCRDLPAPQLPASVVASVKTAIQEFLSVQRRGRF